MYCSSRCHSSRGGSRPNHHGLEPAKPGDGIDVRGSGLATGCFVSAGSGLVSDSTVLPWVPPFWLRSSSSSAPFRSASALSLAVSACGILSLTETESFGASVPRGLPAGTASPQPDKHAAMASATAERRAAVFSPSFVHSFFFILIACPFVTYSKCFWFSCRCDDEDSFPRCVFYWEQYSRFCLLNL